MSRLSKEMENWRQAELRHAAVFGKAALRTKGYQKIRLSEMQRIYQTHQKGKLSLDDRVRLRLIRSGSHHLEKQLYPNRLVRYTRRIVRFTASVAKSGLRQVGKLVERKRNASTEVAFSGKSPSIQVKPVQNKVVKSKVVRIPRKVHQPAQELRQRRGRSI
ncbi:hypothetical protein [Rhizosphaericola mali]|uniref:Uncharacterized protein n=1 Tax=Rhizosphaericola mali TaxID=2545455 RepID=A0A5P2G465_9BACT|nr:hypothetical protein [Rhizosphaericola mali]QES88550.1 hypothetical protein E0W69_007700 [Rhizosphaericola mali]